MLDAKTGLTEAQALPAMIPPGKERLAHAPADHPPVRRAKVGVLLANLGTPDNYDYWSMRRYLNEFL
jgi:ferrochelatase